MSEKPDALQSGERQRRPRLPNQRLQLRRNRRQPDAVVCSRKRYEFLSSRCTAVTRSLYAVGRVVKAIGIRGEVVVELLSASSDRFKMLEVVFVGRNEQEAEQARIEYVKIDARRGLRVKFTQIPSRTEAERLIGSYVFVGEQHRLQLPKGTYFVDNVVGLQVVDETGKRIGLVKEVLKMPAQDVYVIERDGPDVMVPAAREFIRDIDLQTRTITVRLIEGLIGL